MQVAQGLGANNPLHWSASIQRVTDTTGNAQTWLQLVVEVSLPQICQRCLMPMEVAVHIDRPFRFVKNEDIALAEDEESVEEVLVFSRHFDLAGLIEDEVLLGLPLVARHEVCPVEPTLSVADADFEKSAERPNPFSVLRQL